MSIAKSRWGFHPCSYETFRKLKRLNFFLMESLRREASWKRWNNKHPQNRLLYKRTLVSGPLPGGREGQFKIKEVIGPAPEPLRPPVISFNEWSNISASRWQACRPVATEEEVKALPLSEAQIDSLLERFEEWYAIKDTLCV